MASTQTGTAFRLIDPRALDGNPYEVAAASVEQLERLLQFTIDAFDPVYRMIRNADLQRQLEAGEDAPDVPSFEDSVLAKRVIALAGDVELVARALPPVRKAAGYDPSAKL